jgi:hypothetical protein
VLVPCNGHEGFAVPDQTRDPLSLRVVHEHLPHTAHQRPPR